MGAWKSKKRLIFVNKKNVVLLYDNSRPHSAKIIQERLLDLGWSVLPHPLYSTDPASFHLFSSLQNTLNDKKNLLKKIWWKCFGKISYETSWIFTWEKSTSDLISGNKWFKTMANVLLTEINSLLNYSWINDI